MIWVEDLRFIFYIGRFDICLEVSMISYHMTLPREEHLDQVLHLFLSLREYYLIQMIMLLMNQSMNLNIVHQVVFPYPRPRGTASQHTRTPWIGMFVKS